MDCVIGISEYVMLIVKLFWVVSVGNVWWCYYWNLFGLDSDNCYVCYVIGGYFIFWI